MWQFDFYDLFCGAGGTSQGVHLAEDSNGQSLCEVVACINHDATAIMSHAANFPNAVHFTEDIRSFETDKLRKLKESRLHLNRKIILWGSLECTNFSKAKGGMARDADSRTLAEHLFSYIEALSPDYIMIENVEEFMSWGKLDENGKPVSKHKGCDYLKWVNDVCKYGYSYDWRLLNSADFGAHTSRVRYFGIFAKKGTSISFPTPTHTRKPIAGNTLFPDALQQWKPVRECLDFGMLGKSIFTRKKPLVDKTIRRISKGLTKFVDKPMLMTCNSPGYCQSVELPSGTITTAGHKALIMPFTLAYYGGDNDCNGVENPLRTITTVDRFGLVLPVSAWLVNPQYSNIGNSIEVPSPTIIAAQKSYPLSLAVAEFGDAHLQVAASDSTDMKALKQLCQEKGIIDVYMRMLTVDELKAIQGFR